jgi:GNAT superfamily N-acetyltransferase
MINLLDPGRREIASQIHAVFQRSYREEAKLIGATLFPPLLRTKKQIAVSAGSFLGTWMESDLAAVVEYTYNASNLSIDSLVVEPKFFRGGLASELLEALFDRYQWQTAEVETAVLNKPAIALYLRFGFVEAERWMIDCGIAKVRLTNVKAP